MDYASTDAARAVFAKAWDEFRGTPHPKNPRPLKWKNAIRAYHRLGVSDHNIAEAVRIAFERDDVPDDAKFVFALGVMKNRTAEAIAEQQASARASAQARST